jgi:hypothetical protein
LLRLQTSDVAWQQLGLRSEYQPSKKFLARGLYTYDTYQEAWTSLRFDLTYVPGETSASISSRYDGIQHTWSQVNFYLDNLRLGPLKISTSLSYNGYLQQFDSRQYSFIYDLHCAEAVLSITETNFGFLPGRTVAFFIRLKAFPFDTPFGIGNRGAPIGSGTGRDF